VEPGLFEVIVVDNGSREPPDALVARFPGVRLAHEATPGPGPARNHGAGLARGRILAFTDSDCVVDPGWIATIVATFAARPEVEIIGGLIRLMVERPGDPSVAEAFELVYGFRQQMHIERDRFSATANMAALKSVFEAVGPFGGLDISEDLDWGQRAARMGHVTVYVPEMVVHHPARRTMAALHAQWNRHTSHFYRIAAARPWGRLKWALTIPAMAASPVGEIPRILTSDRVSTARERRRAFRGLVAIRLYRARRMLRALLDDRGRTGSTEWNRKDPQG
jgi:GT2 family glycosyltransferase